MNGREFSITSQYDDFCRGYRGCVSSSFFEFAEFARAQDDNRKKWLSTQEKCAAVLRELTEAQSHKEKLELQIQHVTELLKNEVHIRQRVQREEKDLEKKLCFVKQIVSADRNLSGETRDRIVSLSSIDISHRNDFESTRNNFIDTTTDDIECSTRSMLSSLDITSDKTDEDLELSTLRSIRDVKGRRSTDLLDVVHPKGVFRGMLPDANSPRLSVAYDTGNNTTFGMSREDHYPGSDLLKVPVIEVSSSHNIEEIGLDSTTIGTSTGIETSDQSTPTKELVRPHNFVSKVILKQELCTPCNSRIRFGKSAMKCTDCFASCHVDCKDKMPVPCTPVHKTPTQTKVTLADYAPKRSPMIPAVIANCINEIETRGVGYSGLYRTDLHEKEVTCVKEQLLQGKHQPDQLRSIDINVLAGVMRAFLLSFNEPLVTSAARDDFCKLCYSSRSSEVQETVQLLLRQVPQANCETLSYLILHLQSVPISSVAKYFASAIMGGTLSSVTDALKRLQDLKEQQLATEKLISLPSEFWIKMSVSSTDTKSPICKPKRNLKKGFFTSPHF